MILRLTDGISTTNLTGGPVYRSEYVPRQPELSVVEFEPATVLDGGESAAITRRNVTEQCDVVIVANAMEDVQATLHDIETWFMRAIEYQNRRGGSRVWLEFSTDDVNVFRSEILYGRVELGEKPLMWLTGGPALAAALIWRRRYYWEGGEVTLDLVNVHGAGTGGVPVFNHLDDLYDNLVDISAASVEGVLPAPARVELINRTTADIMANVIIGHNVYADPGDLFPSLECEGAVTAVGNILSDANCSGGEYMLVDLAETRAQLLSWTISSADLSHYRGRFFRLWLRCQAQPSAGTYIQPKMILGIGSLQVASEGQESLLNTGQLLQDLGVLQIPPYLMGDVSAFYEMDLALYGRNTNLGTVGLDFLYLMPLDSYRELRPRGYGVADGITLIDDGIEDRIWADGYGSGYDERIGFYYGLGPRVMLVPGMQQRLYFLMSNTSGGAEVDRSVDVIVKYRPRRLTV